MLVILKPSHFGKVIKALVVAILYLPTDPLALTHHTDCVRRIAFSAREATGDVTTEYETVQQQL